MIITTLSFTLKEKVRLALVLLCLCSLTIPAYAQFQRVYGTPWGDVLFDVTPASGGGFVATGYTTGAECGGSDVLLVKLDANGDLVWEKSYGGPSLEDYGQGIVPGSDGGFVVGGHLRPSASIKEDMFLMKVDASGNEVWTRIYGASSWDMGHDVCAASDGGYYLVGRSRNPSTQTGDGVYVVKTNASGVPAWMKVYLVSGSDDAWGVAPDGNGGCVVAGTCRGTNGDVFPLVMRINSSGGVQWSKKYTDPGGATAYDIVATSDERFAITGANYGGTGGWFILKITDNGNIVWTKTYTSSSSGFHFANGIDELSNGDLAVTGETGASNLAYSGLMYMRTNSSGTPVHTRSFAGSPYDHYGNAVTASGSGAMLVGRSAFGTYDNADGYAILANSSGVSGCNEESITVSTNSVTWTATNVSTTVSNRGESSTYEPGNCQVDLSQSSLCPSDCEGAPGYCYGDYAVYGDVEWTTSTYHEGGCGVTANVYIERTLRITANSKLTIGPGVTLFFGEEGRIILENGSKPSQKGGQLVLDGALLTNATDCPWLGIEVWGDAYQSQHPIYDTRSGYLHIKNGTIVQNAENAVRLWKPGDVNRTGGIVKAYESTFRNNRTGVEIAPYQNFFPTTGNPPANNLSFFEQVTFITDGPLVSGENPYAHVTMEDVEGVTFKACKFTNTTAGALYSPARGYGILGIDSRFMVVGKCTNILVNPCPGYIQSEFRGLYIGINAMSVIPARTLRMDHTLLENNYLGVQLQGMDYARVEHCTFDMDNGDLGMTLIGCSDFKIEDNLFTNTNQPGLGRGLVVMNSGNGPNQVYRNTFTDIDVGINPLNINDGPSGKDGLQLRCNTFENCDLDIGVTAYGSTQPYNIAKYQGGCGNDQTTANNAFSHTCSHPEDDYFVVKTHSQPLFYYHLSGMEPQCHDLSFMVLVDCGPEVPGGQVPCPAPCVGLGCMKQAYIGLTGDLTAAEGLMDGGSTSGLLTSILNDPPGVVHSNLAAASPYLSDEVLVQAVNDPNNPMAEPDLLDILLRNSPLQDVVIQAVDAMAPPMSHGARATLDAAQTGVSERQKLEGQIATLESDRKAALNGMIGEWLFNDSIPNPLDSALFYLKMESDEDSRQNEIALMMEKRDYASIPGRLADLVSDFPGSADFASLQNVVLDLRQDPRGLRSLGAVWANVQTILDLTPEEQDHQLWRQAYLVWELNSGDRYYWEMPEIDPASHKRAFEDALPTEPGAGIRLYPNPAGDQIRVSGLEAGWEHLEMSFFDPFGRLVSRAVIREGGDERVQLTDFPAGLYLVRMVDARGQVVVEKLLIQR